MNDREYRVQRRRLRSLAEKWIGRLGLNSWQVDLEYHRDGALPEALTPSCANATVRAVTTVQWEYLRAEVLWNMPAIEALSDGELEEVFVHELMHIHLNEMRAYRSSDG